MALSDEVLNGVHRALSTNVRVARSERVPDKRDLRFLDSGGAVSIDATYAYADLADSSELAQKIESWAAANIIRAYVNAAARVFEGNGGAIRSFDGDRVMAIFMGDRKNSRAALAALMLNWAVSTAINPWIDQNWPNIARIWTMKHVVGIACGEALVVRGGVLGNNDMISIGGAPNIAAKLSDIRPPKSPLSLYGQPSWYSIYVTEQVHGDLSDDVRLGPGMSQTVGINYLFEMSRVPTTVDMWDPLGARDIGGTVVYVRGTDYMWTPNA